MPQTVCTCGTKLEYPEAHAGKKLRCPRCQAIVQAPGAAEPPPEDAVMVAELMPSPAAAISADRPRERGYDTARSDYPDRRWPDPEPLRPASGKATAALIFGILSVIFSVLASLPGILFGILGLRDCSKRQLSGRGTAIVGIVLSCVLPFINGLAILAVLKVQTAQRRTMTMNNMKQIGISWHAYHDTYKQFPGPGLRFVNGQPEMPLQPGLGSLQVQNWRVQILPYMEQQPLYMRFKLERPWDEEPNKGLIALMPRVYDFEARPQPATQTLFQSTEGLGGFLERGKRKSMASVTDGTSNTFMFLEGETSVVWTEPKDIHIDPQQPLALPAMEFLAGMADGSVRFVDRRRVDDRTLRNLINPQDGQVINFDF